MGTQQIAIRLPDELLHQLDRLVAEGPYASRAAAVRSGIEILAELARRSADDAAITAGYRRVPSTSAEIDTAMASLRDAIDEEPW